MAAFTRRNLNPWIAPGGGAAASLIVAAIVLLMPAATLETLVWQSGIAALVPVAQPPLGATARAVLAIGGATLVGAVVWAALFLLFGPGGFLVRDELPLDGMPVLRKADAHPDAPARRPLSARDLGAPMPPVGPPIADPGQPTVAGATAGEAEPPVRPLPDDLDLPLAAFDPAAVPEVPLAPVRAVTPLRPPALAKGERIDSIELPRGPLTDADAPSIEMLLRRLEQGTRRPQRAAAR